MDREKYHDKPVIIIGVHSAKFSNEKEVDTIKEAISRYEINHPVIADKNMVVWQAYKVAGWPTLVVIDPANPEMLSPNSLVRVSVNILEMSLAFYLSTMKD